jgi:hypothetical protein
MLTAMTQPTTPRRRLLLRAGIAVASAAVVLGTVQVVLARFSSTQSSTTSTFSSGSVTLSTTALNTCSVTNLLPNSSPAPCTLKATYSGSVPAYLGLDVLIATKSGSPGNTALYNPSDSTNDLQVTVTDNQGTPVTYVTPSTSFGAALATCPAGSGFDSSYTCYRLLNLLVNATGITSAASPVTFTTSTTLPSTNPTGYQGGTAAIALTVHAVQAGNQSLSGCTVGHTCSVVSWS